MAMRREVEELVDAGVLPTEDASTQEVENAERLLQGIVAPVSNEEAQALAKLFGPDNCFGLSWTLLHLIESAPNARGAYYSSNVDNVWVALLNSRVAAMNGRD